MQAEELGGLVGGQLLNMYNDVPVERGPLRQFVLEALGLREEALVAAFGGAFGAAEFVEHGGEDPLIPLIRHPPTIVALLSQSADSQEGRGGGF